MAKSSIPFTVERLKEVLDYDPETGVFIRLLRTGARAKVGEIAGTTSGNGYRTIYIDGRSYYAHRLAWLYVHGVWPKNNIDHINHNPIDNRLANLRDATKSQNQGNSRIPRHNTSGLKGVHWHARANKWTAQIKLRGKRIYLGLFQTPEAAAEAYKEAALKYFGEFAFC